MLSSGMITPLFFIFPGNFTHSPPVPLSFCQWYDDLYWKFWLQSFFCSGICLRSLGEVPPGGPLFSTLSANGMTTFIHNSDSNPYSMLASVWEVWEKCHLAVLCSPLDLPQTLRVNIYLSLSSCHSLAILPQCIECMRFEGSKSYRNVLKLIKKNILFYCKHC